MEMDLMIFQYNVLNYTGMIEIYSVEQRMADFNWPRRLVQVKEELQCTIRQ